MRAKRWIPTDACEDAVEWVGKRTLAQAWSECERANWMLWKIQRGEGVEHRKKEGGVMKVRITVEIKYEKGERVWFVGLLDDRIYHVSKKKKTVTGWGLTDAHEGCPTYWLDYKFFVGQTNIYRTKREALKKCEELNAKFGHVNPTWEETTKKMLDR